MKIDKISVAGLLSTVTSVVIYWVINSRFFDQGIKWSLFGAHLLLACSGFIAGAWCLKRRRWEGTVYVLTCGYFIYLQLLS
jgi:hypothetical protein